MEEHFSTKKNHNHQHYHHNVVMNVFKSIYLNFTTLRKIENFDGKDCSLWFLLCMCKIS
jgi:hypothetical protein